MEETVQPASRGELPRREVMQTPEEVAAMLRLKALGWGVRRIAGELGCSHMTVRRYLAEGGWVAYRGRGRPRTLSGLEEWVAERFRRHAGNADVVRQEIEREKGIRLTLRTVEREVRHLRRELEAEARATIRFETPPGKQLQIDFGERRVAIGDENVKVYLFVATLGYSRRLYVRAFRNERQESWFSGIEGAFHHFGGITEEVLLDNDRGLVVRHDRATREVEFNARLHAFAKHWGFRPHACAPYRARTKGKDERGVGYVKKNAIAGRRFESWSALEAHLDGWARDVADQRVHGTTGEVPIERFRRAEARALRPIAGVPPFAIARELVRKVQADCVIGVDGNAYSVPWRLIGESVRVMIAGDQLRVSHGGREVAVHQRRTGRFQRVVDPLHFDGVVGSRARMPAQIAPVSDTAAPSELLRPLLEYERLVGGRW
ncbi:IS21 family transposase [Bradyrhizobium sp.]|uniref:IS21 family transposase n=1 Tax=Bradyrhizobium sp. TaxID=376 RepID=UPI0025BD7DB3|nr:IS21 family transposase [Bradyrhizobium sp.]MBV8918883.1 IS21 family transposase [Bradyrhizobium sp.]